MQKMALIFGSKSAPMLDDQNDRSGCLPGLMENAGQHAVRLLIGAAGLCSVEELIR